MLATRPELVWTTLKSDHKAKLHRLLRLSGVAEGGK